MSEKEEKSWYCVLRYTSEGRVVFKKICDCGHREDDDSYLHRFKRDIIHVLNDWMTGHSNDVCPRCNAKFSGESWRY
jgi:hypothetical protein